jgi:hypothetical protein
MIMQTQDIEHYLADLGQTLQDWQIEHPVRILMVGGAFMLTQMRNRPTTKDIDVILKDVDDSATSTLYRTFKSAIRAVANKNRIPDNWMNDLIGDFLRDASVMPVGMVWRRYAMLEVYVPEPEYILALKLLAGRQKDRHDILILRERLQIRTRDQAQGLVDRYIPNKQLQQLYNLDDTLSDVFA